MTNLAGTKIRTVADGVSQRDFSVEVHGETVPCVIWMPQRNSHSPDVLIAMAHGGSQHKKAHDLRKRAIGYAKSNGWVTLSIDAPPHGDRISREEAARKVRETKARVNGEKGAPAMAPAEKIEFLDGLAEQAVPEWQAALDAVLAADVFENTPSIAYWGVSMGSTIGIPLLATDTRFECAVLGLAELHPQNHKLREAARRVTVPLRFIFQWDDVIRNRKYGLDLYEAFGSTEKSMHINPGGHADFPVSEADSWQQFFRRLLA